MAPKMKKQKKISMMHSRRMAPKMKMKWMRSMYSGCWLHSTHTPPHPL